MMLADSPSLDQPMIGHRSSALERCPDPLNAIESVAATRPCNRGEALCGREDPTRHWYRLVSGLGRDCAVMADGRRQIVDFVMPGNFFGFASRDERQFTVEAVVDGTVVARYPRQVVEMLADSNPGLARRLREMAFEAISRSQARVLILGRMSAIEKVSLFLLEMAERSCGSTAGAVLLPMSRYDIADYLALSVETVCRALTHLKRCGAIVLTGIHRVKIVDRAALEACNGADAQPVHAARAERSVAALPSGLPNAGTATQLRLEPRAYLGLMTRVVS